MDPSEEKKEAKKRKPEKRWIILSAATLFTLVLVAGATVYYLNSSPELVATPPVQIEKKSPKKSQQATEGQAPPALNATESSIPDSHVDAVGREKYFIDQVPLKSSSLTPAITTSEVQELTGNTDAFTPPPMPVQAKSVTGGQQETRTKPICLSPEQSLDSFYEYLDSQEYMTTYNLKKNTQQHFTTLINKLLANPPQVTRESDNLYTILKNTAHFFRVSGSDNIFMLKGIINNENDKLEMILEAYFLLVTLPDCSSTKYANTINRDALYEYACFFLNTMGGRLYLFRRGSQSRLIVTYYAILLVALADQEQNNHHGLALKPSVNILISEMENSGSRLKHIDKYLDKLYELKEKYQ